MADAQESPSTQHSKNQQTSNEEWKFRAPYKIHENMGEFPIKHEASCHCGRVTYQLSRDKPLASKFCHCITCQTIHGAPFQWAAIFEKGDINFTDGVHGLEWYDSTHRSMEHKLPCKVRCGFCGTWIMDEGRNMILLFPTLIKFQSEEDKKKFDVMDHIFYPQRVVDIKDGKRKWSGLDRQSDLLDEMECHEEGKNSASL